MRVVAIQIIKIRNVSCSCQRASASVVETLLIAYARSWAVAGLT
jgi:hypothetical protein